MTIVTHPDREAWAAARLKCLGASEIAAALNCDPYKSRFALAAEKISGEREVIDSLAAEIGSELEPLVIRRYAKQSGRSVARWNQCEQVVSPWFDWLRCTPDAIQFDAGGNYGTAQIKTTAERMGVHWTGEPPLHVQIQAQFEAAMIGYQTGTVVVLIGNNRLEWFDFQVKPRFIEGALTALEKFWAMVQAGVLPDADGSDSTANAIARLWPQDDGESIELSEEIGGLVEDRETHNAQIKFHTAAKQEAENRIKAAMGESTFGVLPNGGKVTYKTSQREGYFVKPTTFRTLRITKGKDNGDR